MTCYVGTKPIPKRRMLSPRERLAAAANICDSVVVTTVVVADDEATRPRVQITAVGERTAVDYKQATVSNVEDYRLSFGIIRILDEFKDHDVVALQPREVALDVAQQICGVGAGAASPSLLVHSCFPLVPVSVLTASGSGIHCWWQKGLLSSARRGGNHYATHTHIIYTRFVHCRMAKCLRAIYLTDHRCPE